MRIIPWLAVAATVGICSDLRAEDYTFSADSLPQEGVPRGTVTQYHLTDSTAFPGTERDYWIYVPAGNAALVVAGLPRR